MCIPISIGKQSLVLLAAVLLVWFEYTPLQGQSSPDSIPPDVTLQTITADNASELRELARLSPVYDVPITFTSDSQKLYFGGGESPIESWDFASGSRQEFPAVTGYFGFAISPDDQLIGVNSSSDLGGFQLYDVPTGKMVADIPCSGGSRSIWFSPTDSHLLLVGWVSGKPESGLDFWVIKPDMLIDPAGETIQNCKPDTRFPVDSLANVTLSPDGKLLFYDNKLLDMATLKDIAALPQTDDNNFAALATFGPDSQLAVETSGDGVANITLWGSVENIQNNHPQAVLALDDDKLLSNASVDNMAFNRAGDILVVSGAGTLPDQGISVHFVELWDVAALQPIKLFTSGFDYPGAISLAFSPDGKLLAVSSDSIVLYGIPQ